MRETHQEIPDIVYAKEEVSDVIHYFEENAPTRKPNLSEYMSYLNRIEGRIGNSKLRKYEDYEIVFYIPGSRLNEIIFTPGSITWTWEHDGGKDRNPFRKSVNFYFNGDKTLLKLEKSELIKGNKLPLTTTTIVMGNGPKVSLTTDAGETQILLEKISSHFSKPK